MGNWTPEVKSEPIEFDGDLITITANRLSVEHMVSLTRHITIGEDGSTKISFSESIEVCKAAADIFPTAIVAIEGMVVGGSTIDKDRFCELTSKEFYFIPLVGEVLKFLMGISQINETDKGE